MSPIFYQYLQALMIMLTFKPGMETIMITRTSSVQCMMPYTQARTSRPSHMPIHGFLRTLPTSLLGPEDVAMLQLITPKMMTMRMRYR